MKIKILLPNKERILEMSEGEVTARFGLSPNLKPRPDGIFCQKIFGPVDSYRCSCGLNSKGRESFDPTTPCPKCGVLPTNSWARRERWGHIALGVPVVHPLFKDYISKLLNISPKKLEAILEYKLYMVLQKGYSPFEKGSLITFEQYLEFKQTADDLENRYFRALSGGILIKESLMRLDLDKLMGWLLKQDPSRRINKRLAVVRKFINSEEKITPTDDLIPISCVFSRPGSADYTITFCRAAKNNQTKQLPPKTSVRSNPADMVLEVIPVLPADIRPALLLEDGTMCSADINDLYLRILHRNNKVKESDAKKMPEVMRNEARRNLQWAVEALYKNERVPKFRQVKNRSGKHVFKSVTAMLSGKEGRLRRNLLGKRVDYSARSVIAAGPTLQMHQVGLPLGLAMNIFKPFVYGRLRREGYAGSLKQARKLADIRNKAALDALEVEMSEKVVLLNRAPSLHRMSFQAFYPILVPGKAIRLHPLVCSPFNADFDGDQLGVHLPLSPEAQIECRLLISPIYNLLSPASGKLVMSPSQDIVLGIYCLTKDSGYMKGEGKVFADKEDVITAHELGYVHTQARIRMRLDGEIIDTTPGRVIFADIFPADMPFSLFNKTIKKKDQGKLFELCYEQLGPAKTVQLLEKTKDMGYKFATQFAVSISALSDVPMTKKREEIIQQAQEKVDEIKKNLGDGQITESEKHNQIVAVWSAAKDEVMSHLKENFGVPDNPDLTDAQKKEIRNNNSLYMMADSGARGNAEQMNKMGGMIGLIATPTGDIIELPVKSNYKLGSSVPEFMQLARGARKGRADQAMKTADSGYFTRRLVDLGQDVIVNTVDCYTTKGRYVNPLYDNDVTLIELADRLFSRVAAEDIKDPTTGEILVKRNNFISKKAAGKIQAAGITGVKIRSPLTCEAEHGVCAMCYGLDLSTRDTVEIGQAVGIIAGQSIGEPGTQLTLNSFHSGGSAKGAVAKSDIQAMEDGIIELRGVKYVTNNQGKQVVLNRNGRVILKKGITEMDLGSLPCGAVLEYRDGATVHGKGLLLAQWDAYNTLLVAKDGGLVSYEDIIEGVTIKSRVNEKTSIEEKVVTGITGSSIPKMIIGGHTYNLPVGAILEAKEGAEIGPGDIIARIPKEAAKNMDMSGGLHRVLQVLEVMGTDNPAILSEIEGDLTMLPPEKGKLSLKVVSRGGVEKIYTFPAYRQQNFYDGDTVKAGDILVDGVIDSRDVLHVAGPGPAANYIIDAVQKEYRKQGVDTNDKHLEVLVAKMLRFVRITSGGNTKFTAGDIVTKREFFKENQAAKGEKAMAIQIVQGLTDAALRSDSWLSAASFQETASVLAEAAICRKVDPMIGLKENVIAGNLIPAGTGHKEYLATVIKKDTSRRTKKNPLDTLMRPAWQK